MEHIRAILASMDADSLVTVRKNRQDLEDYVNNPEHCKL